MPGPIRLAVVDMDGTLLDPEGRVPDGLWPLLARMRSAGVLFVPASGRQYATLAAMFAGVDDGMAYVAENGAYVVRDGVELSSDPIDPAAVSAVVERLRAHARTGADVGVVLCGTRTAYVERVDARFLARCEPYYRALEQVDDLSAHVDGVVKVAVHDFGDPQDTADALAGFVPAHQVVVSGAHWVDLMAGHVDKGRAVARLQEQLGISPAETAAFGDQRNDLEMLDRAELSYAMAQAHPDVLARARYAAPSNAEAGVVTVLTQLLDAQG